MPARDEPQVLRERAFVPTLVYIGTVVSIISSLGAPLDPLDRARHARERVERAVVADRHVARRRGRHAHRGAPGRRAPPPDGDVACLAIVSVGGALAAVAGTLPLLIAGRAMQGVGLALMPLTMAAARDHLSDRRAPGVIALLSVVAAVGVGLGYPITGFIAEHASLETAFWPGRR